MPKKKPQRTGKGPLVLGFLEGISSAVFQRYSDQITGLVGRQQGVYALYKGDRLYYVGLATNLRRRVKQHLRDRHAGKWSRFSVYLVRKADHIKELESLILRIADPAGNSVRGRLVHAENLLPGFRQKMKQASDREIATLLGERGRKRRPKTAKAAKARKTSGRAASKKKSSSFENPALAPYVSRRFVIRATYKGNVYQASVHANGNIQFQGKKFYSPSGAAQALLGRAQNGWLFWRYRNSSGDWVALKELKKG